MRDHGVKRQIPYKYWLVFSADKFRKCEPRQVLSVLFIRSGNFKLSQQNAKEMTNISFAPYERQIYWGREACFWV